MSECVDAPAAKHREKNRETLRHADYSVQPRGRRRMWSQSGRWKQRESAERTILFTRNHISHMPGAFRRQHEKNKFSGCFRAGTYRQLFPNTITIARDSAIGI